MKGVVVKFTRKPVPETLAILIKCPKKPNPVVSVQAFAPTLTARSRPCWQRQYFGQIGNVNKFFRQGMEQMHAGRISQDGADVYNNIPINFWINGWNQ